MKKIIIGTGIILLIFSCFNNKKKKTLGEKCYETKVSEKFLQPVAIVGGNNLLPFTAFNYIIENVERDECNLYKIIRYEEFYKGFPISGNKLRKFVFDKNEILLKQKKYALEQIKKIENDTGIELTSFEEDLIAEIYLINKYNFKVIRNGAYTFTIPGTPEKINFFIKELGLKNGIEYITFYYSKNKQYIEVDLNNIINYNPKINIPNKNYKTIFKEYDKYIYQDLVDKQIQENTKLAEEEKKKKEEELKKQIEEQNKLLLTPSTSSSTNSDLPLVELSTDNSNTSSSSTETPLLEVPQYEPKEIKKPRSGGSINFEKQERPSREKNNWYFFFIMLKF